MKRIKKVFALLLVLCMVIGMLPLGMFASAEETETLSDEPFYKIVHLDCGRKYFTKDWIIALINEMAADGYNQLQLAFGNDGLRFLLDDMTFTANGTTYSHANVVSAVESGNRSQNGSGDPSWLTQTEMDDIIAAAKAKGIEIVPLLNLPGHANAILDIANDAYNVNGSSNTLDMSNTAAVNFAMAIFQKYVDYFAGKGCKFFSFGADEYANDISGGSFSFSRLNTTGYQSFVGFINNMAEYIEGKGMTPRAFNDGLYYGSWSNVSIDTKIQCCYWSSGWSGYNVASASTIAGKGHQMINTHGDYYYVLGKSDNFDGGYSYASNWDNKMFPNTTFTEEQAGSMFCIWCDYPNAETETQIAANVRLTLRAMAAEMSGRDANSIDTTAVVSGGFNADGSINTVSSSDETDGTVVDIPLVVGGTATKRQEGVNNKENVDLSKLDETIATVDVTGVDAVEASEEYNEASVTCHTLINGNANAWKAVPGYYYKAEDGNYYPLYAKRSSSGYIIKKYTYTWGYSTTGAANNVKQIGTQSTHDTSDAPNITVYTKSETAAVAASTTVTFTGVYPGTTYVKVGDTTYKIVVSPKTEDITIVLGEGPVSDTQTKAITGEAKIGDSSVVNVEVNDATVTFTGLKVGNTTVTVGDTIYTVRVTNVDLSEVDPLTIEYWITNGRPTDNGSNSYSVTAQNAYSEAGVDVATLLPANTTKETRTLQYWRCRLLDTTLSNSSSDRTQQQTEDAGDDETYSGVEFTKVRYWNGTWAVYTENNEWVPIISKYQLVAYYLEILPVADELTVTAADWGKKGDGSSSGDYLEPASSCTVSIQVVYEDGTTNPASTTAADLKSSTIAYGYWSGGRGVGTLNLVGLEGYQIWKVEAETGAMTYANSSSTWGSFTVNSFTWDNNAMTVYEGDPVDSYVIHNNSNNPSKDGYYQNLMWDENYEAILIKVYVKAAETEDSLGVHYIDQTANQEFYNYNIAVVAGTLFNANIGLADPWKGNLANGSVSNILNVTQTVSADLSTMPAIGAQYRYSDYTCVNVVRSEDGKDVYLYYTFNNAHSFVVDFGLPLTITTDALGINGNWTSASVSGAKYGTATATVGSGVTYTPTKIMQGIETLQLTLTDSTDSATHQIYIYPATTVYYEEGFATLNGFTAGSKGTGTQVTQVAGDSTDEYGDEYGYDAKYAGESNGPSNGTQATSSAKGATASFTFTGTGVDIYANSTTSTGWVMIKVANSAGATVKLLQVNTALKNGTTDATTGQAVTGYNIPVAAISGLAHGNYTVTITHIDDATVNLDGFRVYGTLAKEPDFYKTDLEDNPTFIEVRDQVLAGLSVTSDGSGQVNATLPTGANAVIVASSEKYTQENVNDLLTNGPKNEIYLQPNQALVLKITTAREVQIGLKVLDKATTYTITGKDGNQTLNTSTDMFYTVLNQNTSGEQTITITNTGSGILAVTKLKVCDDPNATLLPLKEGDLQDALVALGLSSTPGEGEDDETAGTVTLSIEVKAGEETLTTELTAEVGEDGTHIFTAEEIQKAAEALELPEGYTLSDVTYTDVTVSVNDDELKQVSFTAVKAAEGTTPPPATGTTTDNKGTGDSFSALPWLLAMAVSGAAIALVALRKKRTA